MPRELRDEIWQLSVCTEDRTGIHLQPDVDINTCISISRNNHPEPITLFALTQICKQIRNECRDLVVELNQVHIGPPLLVCSRHEQIVPRLLSSVERLIGAATRPAQPLRLHLTQDAVDLGHIRANPKTGLGFVGPYPRTCKGALFRPNMLKSLMNRNIQLRLTAPVFLNWPPDIQELALLDVTFTTFEETVRAMKECLEGCDHQKCGYLMELKLEYWMADVFIAAGAPYTQRSGSLSSGA
jgi:hypothetical protein